MLTKKSYGRTNLFGSRKGQFQNYVAGILFFIVFSFIAILATLFYVNFQTALSDNGFYTGEVKATGDRFLTILTMFDYIGIFLIVILIAASAVTTVRIATAPVFFVLTLIFLPILGFISYFFNYLFAALISPSAFTSVLVYFPRTILIATNLHWVMLLFIVVGSIGLYAKKEKGQFVE